MHWLEICILHFPEAVFNILLDAAAAGSGQDMGAFPEGLGICDTVWILSCLHEKTPFVFLFSMCEKTVFMRQLARFVPYIFVWERQW